MKAEETFCKLVEKFTYKGEGRRSAQLTNITFFLGAGFAKSWDEHYPLGTELFEFEDVLSKKGFESLVPFIEQCGFNPTKKVDFNIYSECYYKLEMLKKYPEIRPRYIDEQTISIVEAEFKALIWQALSERVRINYAVDNNVCHDETNKHQKAILKFFFKLFEQCDGSEGIPEGIRAKFITTNYDYLIEGILDEYDQSFEDYHYIYTYRGFTPRLINGERNIQPVHSHILVSNLFKINGGLEIRQDG